VVLDHVGIRFGVVRQQIAVTLRPGRQRGATTMSLEAQQALILSISPTTGHDNLLELR
jgi:hypothetical protein